jgi:chaperonin GroEL
LTRTRLDLGCAASSALASCECQHSPTPSRSPSAPRGRNVVIEKSFGAPPSPRTASPSPRRSSSTTPTRTWAPRWSRRSPARPPTSPATAPPPPPSSPRPSYRGPQERRRRRQPDRSSAASRRPSPPPIVAELKKLSTPVKDSKEIAQVGTISANHDAEIGKIIAEAMDKVGKDGVITVEEGKSLETDVDSSRACSSTRATSPLLRHRPDAWRRARGPLHPHPREEDQQHQGPAPAAREGRRSRQAPADHRRGHRGRGPRHPRRQQAPRHPQGRAVKAPGFGDRRKAMLEDIAILTGGRCIMRGPRHQAREAQLNELGKRQEGRHRQGQHHHRRGRRRPPPTSRAASSRSAARSRTPLSDYDREKLQERLAKLAGGVAVRSTSARRPSRDEGEEGPRRGRAARDPRGRRGGHRPRRRRRAAPRRKPSKRPSTSPRRPPATSRVGVDIVTAPRGAAPQIAANAASTAPSSPRPSRSKNPSTQLRLQRRTDEYGDLVKMGVIDPTKVERTALQNAGSVSRACS